MSLLQQDKNASNGNNVDPMQFQHQQLMSQFQRTVSSTTVFSKLIFFFVLVNLKTSSKKLQSF